MGRPETPVDRLLLAGATAHPGGGVHGAAGANAARAALVGRPRKVGIAVGGAMKEISGSIKDFPVERADGGTVDDAPEDELSRRRARRARRRCPR